jgi:hypothetical protein
MAKLQKKNATVHTVVNDIDTKILQAVEKCKLHCGVSTQGGFLDRARVRWGEGHQTVTSWELMPPVENQTVPCTCGH